MINELKTLLDNSHSILITSHISPDPDAVCSSLLLYKTLKDSYGDKSINLVLEERPNVDLSFLNGYEEIEFSPLASHSNESFDLLIIVDANKLGRCTRTQDLKLSYNKLAIIDHHEPSDKQDSDIYINSGYPAATQEIYDICFSKLGLQKPAGYADIAALGILSDTFRFKYFNPNHRETFALMSELIDAGVSIETLENRLETYTVDQLSVLGHTLNNLASKDNFNYSYIDDSFASHWQESGKSLDDFKSGNELFTNQFIRNIVPNNWGFIVYQEMVLGKGHYSVSLRSVADAVDVSKIAGLLGGGGHKPAAGAKFEAADVHDAVNKVLTAIEQSRSS